VRKRDAQKRFARDRDPTGLPVSTGYQVASIVQRIRITIRSFSVWWKLVSRHIFTIVTILPPKPKLNQPRTPQDYRPISITPILSRIMKKSLVRSLLYPILKHPDYSQNFSHQFGFRPTGSTTAMLIYLFHSLYCYQLWWIKIFIIIRYIATSYGELRYSLTNMLQQHDYVHVISLDFSKAFNTVRHHSLISKFRRYPILDCFHNWSINYLHSRQHQTVAEQEKSDFLPIQYHTRIWPRTSLLHFNATDLYPINPSNKLYKYADDTYLLIPAKTPI